MRASNLPLLHEGELTLKLLSLSDRKEWEAVRARNQSWLQEWEATRPELADADPLPSFREMVKAQRQDASERRSFSFGIWLHLDQRGTNPDKTAKFIGQLTLGGIVYGAYRGGYIGYWIDEKYAGRGYMPRAVIRATEFAFSELGLHRIEINIRPENGASIRVAEKAGYNFEGERGDFLHINGAWRNHLTYVAFNRNI